MGLERVPCDASGPERTERDAQAAQVAVHGGWVEIPEQSGQMLMSDPLDESGRSCFRDDQPALRRGAILDSVQQDRLPGTTGPGVEGCSAGGSWPILDGLDELLDKVVPTDEQRRADAEAWVEWVRHTPTLQDF